MTKTILLTRSKEDNEILRDNLTKQGYACIECSLLSSVNLPFDPQILNSYDNIIITSKRAAKLMPTADRLLSKLATKEQVLGAYGPEDRSVLNAREDLRTGVTPQLPLVIEFRKKSNKNAWVVGNVSAEILCQKNYNIKYIAASATELKAQIPKDIYPGTIYLASNMISIKMPDEIKMLQVYEVTYKDELTKDEIKLLKKGVDYILLYSENCAKTLVKLIVENDLLKYLENAIVIAISSKVEMVVKDYFKNRIVGREPNVILSETKDPGDGSNA